jgi:hypothetical protein
MTAKFSTIATGAILGVTVLIGASALSLLMTAQQAQAVPFLRNPGTNPTEPPSIPPPPNCHGDIPVWTSRGWVCFSLDPVRIFRD